MRSQIRAVDHLGLASVHLLYANVALALKKPHSGAQLAVYLKIRQFCNPSGKL